jgi:hypothetical protein
VQNQDKKFVVSRDFLRGKTDGGWLDKNWCLVSNSFPFLGPFGNGDEEFSDGGSATNV